MSARKKILRILKLNYILVATRNLSWFYKLEIIFEELYGALKQSIGVKRFKYLDQRFEYDNPSTIFTILLYPAQVNHEVLELVEQPIRKVLDIGGNLGQFSITLSKLNEEIERIDVFEPNTEVWDLLHNNVYGIEQIRTYNLGIGEEGEQKFYFTEDKSAKGSLIKDNAVVSEDQDLVETDVKLVSDPSEVTGINEYDLLVLDVEGYEYEVIKNIQNVKCKYLYVEVSAGERERNFTSSEILQLIREKWGEFEILGQSELGKGDPAYDVLLEFISPDK